MTLPGERAGVSSSFWCEGAWLGAGPRERVLVECADGVITSVTADVPAPAGAYRLSGMVFPGFADAHSHAFHRALRGRTHADGGTFWTWRDAMYRLAARLDPDGYHRLAMLVFGELVRAGFTCVGEFHYLHHAPGGRPYADPNAMGVALAEAAREAGIRLTLLDTCYLAGGLSADGYQPLTGPQLRFGDGDLAGWLSRVDSLRVNCRVGLAVHSVRAVPADQLRGFDAGGRPVHVHLSEQSAENEACQAYHRCSPTELLSGLGVLGPATTAVHATHLSSSDIALLSGTTACFCPTTEADLADGIGPATDLATGSPLALGTDQHAVVDPFAEVRGLEYGARVRSGRRGRFTPAQLVTAATSAGYRALGWDGGRLEVGAVADLVAVRPTGAAPDQVILAAGAADVATVVVGGRVVVADGWHETMGTVGPELARVIGELWA